MPFGDGTGPRGMGPMTGRGAGYCISSGRPDFNNPIFGRRWFGLNRYFDRFLGRGIDRGRGRRLARRGFNQFAAYPRW